MWSAGASVHGRVVVVVEVVAAAAVVVGLVGRSEKIEALSPQTYEPTAAVGLDPAMLGGG